jgi:hypothetical protein
LLTAQKHNEGTDSKKHSSLPFKSIICTMKRIVVAVYVEMAECLKNENILKEPKNQFWSINISTKELPNSGRDYKTLYGRNLSRGLVS